MKNSLGDLNNYLFEELERLQDDEEMKDETSFEKEIRRAKAVADISMAIASNAKLALDAHKLALDYGTEAALLLEVKR